AQAGYLTRRLINAAHRTIVVGDDCAAGLTNVPGIWEELRPGEKPDGFAQRLAGRVLAAPVCGSTGWRFLEPGMELDEASVLRLVNESSIATFKVRSPLTCLLPQGLCRACYGVDLAKGALVAHGVAVGIVAAQAIGEPGTQLTMRTFHTGGVAGHDITMGLPRVIELFEARRATTCAVLAELDGVVRVQVRPGSKSVSVSSAAGEQWSCELPSGMAVTVTDGA